MKKIANVLFAVLAMFLSACTIIPPIARTESNSAKQETMITSPLVDGTTVTTAIVDFQEINPKTGENSGVWKRTVQVFQNLPILGEVTKAIAGTVPAAATQGLFGLEIAKKNDERCANGNCGGTIIQNLNRNEAGALSNSESNAGASVRMNGSTCTGGCLAK